MNDEKFKFRIHFCGALSGSEDVESYLATDGGSIAYFVDGCHFRIAAGHWSHVESIRVEAADGNA